MYLIHLDTKVSISTGSPQRCRLESSSHLVLTADRVFIFIFSISRNLVSKHFSFIFSALDILEIVLSNREAGRQSCDFVALFGFYRLIIICVIIKTLVRCHFSFYRFACICQKKTHCVNSFSRGSEGWLLCFIFPKYSLYLFTFVLRFFLLKSDLIFDHQFSLLGGQILESPVFFFIGDLPNCPGRCDFR